MSRRQPDNPAKREQVRQRQKNLFDLAGKVELRPDFDHKEMRRLRGGSD